MAESCTNRQLENVLQQMFICLQLLLVQGKVKVKERKVARAAKSLTPYKGTVFQKEFIKTRMKSWLIHLQRISPFLLRGEGVWWYQTSEAYCFLDGDQHSLSKVEGPHLLHYRSTSHKQLDAAKKVHWEAILRKGTTLPTPYIQHYNTEGMPTHRTFFPVASTATTIESSRPQPPAVTVLAPALHIASHKIKQMHRTGPASITTYHPPYRITHVLMHVNRKLTLFIYLVVCVM